MHDLVGGFTLDALHRRDATCLQKRHLRSILHHCRFSRPRPVRSIGHNNRQQIDPDMQVLGRYILSAIYSALSVHVFVLRMVDKERTVHFRPDLASGTMCLCVEHIGGLSMPETI